MRTTAGLARRASFLGLEFDLLEEPAAVRTALELSQHGSFSYVLTPNVDHMVRLLKRREDGRLWSAYRRAELCLCDSRILKALAARSGVTLPLVTGSDLTAAILNSLSEPATAAVIGGDQPLLDCLRARYPSVTWFHHEAPRGILYNPQAQLQVVDFVENCPATLLFFALGSPQSEIICALTAERPKARGVGLCIGASLEFLTGAKKRAPRWIQKAGLEWLFRLTSEPSRLWKRYLVEGPTIFWYWARWLLTASR